MTATNHRSEYAFYMPSFVGGGAERNCVLLANEFFRRGFSVRLIVDRNDGPNRRLLTEGVVVEELGGGGHFSDVLQLRRVLFRRRPSVVYAQVGLSPIKYLLASMWLPVRTWSVIVYHGIYDPQWRLGAKLSYWLAPFVSRLFDSVVAVSHSLSRHLRERFQVAPGVRAIHNPIDLGLVNGLAAADATPISQRPYIVAMGRMVPQKDFSTLIKAFALIADRMQHDLVILGDGPLRPGLVDEIDRLGIAHRVVLPGYVENPFPILGRADAFVLSSVHEAFGNVLVEALALGLRVVSTDCPGGPREILSDGKFGALCRMGSPQALADATLASLSAPHDPALGKARALDFSVDRIADQYIALARTSSD